MSEVVASLLCPSALEDSIPNGRFEFRHFQSPVQIATVWSPAYIADWSGEKRSQKPELFLNFLSLVGRFGLPSSVAGVVFLTEIAAIANRLRQSDKLGAFGKPLIVECLIPASFVTHEFWRDRSYAMLEDYFKRLLRPSEKHHIEPSYAVVTEPIPPENILRVHEFTEIKRPYRELNPFTGATDAWTETTFRPFKIWPRRAQL